MKKRLLASLLALCMVMSVMPFTAFADDESTPGSVVVETDPADGQDTTTTESKTPAEDEPSAVEKVQALIDAIPEEVTEENVEDVKEQLIAIDEAKAALSDEEADALVIDKYVAAISAINALENQPGASVPETLEETVKVAKVDGTEYDTLSAAINVANGKTVTLLADVEEDVTIPENTAVTLDLAGKKLTNKTGHTITNNGTLTITGGGTVDNVSHGKAAFVNNGTATIESGNFTRSAESSTTNDKGEPISGGNSWYVVWNTGELTIKGGTFKFSEQNSGLFSSLIVNGWPNPDGNTDGKYAELKLEGGNLIGGKITIKNDDYGILTMKEGAVKQTESTYYAVFSWNEATITGGTVDGGIGAEGDGKGVYENGSVTISGDVTVTGYIEALDKSTISISGGTLDGIYVDSATADISVTGGTFNYDNPVKVKTNVTIEPFISGGTFKSDVNDYVIPGNEAVEDENGNYTIEVDTKKAVAQIGTVGYDTLQAAVAAAQNGDTITLLSDITVSGTNAQNNTGAIDISKSITIDGNGKTITAGEGFTGTSGAHVINVTGGNVTIKNLTIDGKSTSSTSGAHSGINVYTASGAQAATVEINNVTIKNCSTYGVTTQGSNVTATKLVTENNGWGGVNVDNRTAAADGGKFTMKSGTLNEANSLYIENGGAKNTGATVEIEDGTFYGAVSIEQKDNMDVNGVKLTVKGGNYAKSVDENYLDASVKAELYSTAKNAKAPYSYYKSVEDAMNAANSEDDIVKQVKTTGEKVTVTFDAGKGSCDIKSVTVAKGEKITLPKATRSGYTFEGWYNQDTGKYVGGKDKEITVEKDLKLYAEWEKKSSSGSSSSGDYSITVKSVKNGKVTVSPKSADKGDTVTITVKPDSGYVLDSLTITDKNGDEVKYKEKSDTKFTFTMPKSKVTIKAEFALEKDEDKTIVLTIGSTLATVYGTTVINDVAPLARNNRTMLPIRFVAEALGARVDWDQAQQKVTITRDTLLIEIFLNSDVAYVNGAAVQLDSPAFAENNRTYLPLRFVAENLGAQVDWDQATQTVTITAK